MTTPHHRVTSYSAGWFPSVLLLLGPREKSNREWHCLTHFPQPLAFSLWQSANAISVSWLPPRLPHPALPAGRRTPAEQFLTNDSQHGACKHSSFLTPDRDSSELWLHGLQSPLQNVAKVSTMELDLKCPPSLISFPSLTYFPTISGFPGITS